MTKNFFNNVVFTSQYKEGFLNFYFTTGEASIYIFPRANISSENLFLNGIDISLYTQAKNIGFVEISEDVSFGSFLIHTNSIEDFTHTLYFDTYADPSFADTSTNTIEVTVKNRPFIINSSTSIFNTYDIGNMQIEDETSYLVLRTNPKFTGNIKLVIDGSNNLYLDTFKVSDVLSDKKYRKKSVSSEGALATHISTTFNSLPRGDIYSFPSQLYDVALPYTSYNDQFDMTYSYGAKLFEDDLYEDDYSILAPLWINKNIPDYFVIFRLDSPYNEESYSYNSDLTTLGLKFINDSNIVKTYSMKTSSDFGKYIRNHKDALLTYNGQTFITFSDKSSIDYDDNKWYGISLDYGIISEGSETTYDFNINSSDFTSLNAFVSNGFQRNNLLMSNLINIEYAFSDTDVSEYTMHRYFGLYLTENELYQISYYTDTSTAPLQIISHDNKTISSFYNSNIFNTTGDISTNYKNRIFTINDINNVKRITNKYQINGANSSTLEFIGDWLNKPGDNLFSATTYDFNTNIKRFITLSISNLLESGEHLRLINNTTNIIWEIYGTNSDLISAGDCWPYASTSINTGFHTIYRAMFSTKGTIDNQIEAIYNAFSLFTEYDEYLPFYTYQNLSGEISLIINTDYESNQWYFQRLTSGTADPSTGVFNDIDNYGDVVFYGIYTPDSSSVENLNFNDAYGPIDMELYGNRKSISIELITINSSYHTYSIDDSYSKYFVDYMMYQSSVDNWYRLININDININKWNGDSYTVTSNYIVDPITSNRVLLITPTSANKISEKLNVYQMYKLNVCLMGINPVKDIDYTVYDGIQSNYWYKRENDDDTNNLYINRYETKSIIDRNSYVIKSGDGSIYIDNFSFAYSDGSTFNTFDSSAILIASSNSIISYNNESGTGNFTSIKTGVKEESIDGYYLDPSTTLKYSLICPEISKWVINGTDCRGNKLRLIANSAMLETSSNFIPYKSNFSNELSYPVFKYLSSNGIEHKSYVYYDINDILINGSTRTTLKNLMLTETTTDIFSKLLYTSNNYDGNIRSTIAYYNSYKESIDGIINGLNISISVNSIAKNYINIKNYDRYKISLISSPSRNHSNNRSAEVIINENTETILIIWYQGNDVLNYNKRNSSTLCGKFYLSDSSNASISGLSSYIENNNKYSFVKGSYLIDTGTPEYIVSRYFGWNKGNLSSTIDSSEINPYAQLNKSKYNLNGSSLISFRSNSILANGFVSTKRLHTLDGSISYDIAYNRTSIGNNIVNFDYLYDTNNNLYTNLTCDISSFNYIISTNDKIYYYIIKEDTTLTSDNFIGSDPLKISINNPVNYDNIITYHGWYTPNFKNILEFSSNEDRNLIDIVDIDFTMCNTNYSSSNEIDQLWYKKVVTNISSDDVSDGNAISNKPFNVFSSLWDGKYFRLKDNDSAGGYKEISGFNSSLEKPSFFGSKLIKMPQSLTFTEWNSTLLNWEFDKSRATNIYTFNLSQTITNRFKNNPTFLNNWSGLGATGTIIDNYIKDTVINYYNIEKSKITTVVYRKLKSGNDLSISYTLNSSDFTLYNEANIEGTVYNDSNDWVYNVEILEDIYQYFFEITIFEK